MIPLAVKLGLLFLVGASLGSLVNWAIYSLAWRPRSISPWSAAPPGAGPRRWSDRLPIVGWLTLNREAAIHGTRFWLRPMLLELGLGAAVAALYWWEIVRLGLIQGQIGAAAAIVPPAGALYWQTTSHVILLCWMLAASFIDIDEKIIPDEITVTGTLLGLTLAVFAPLSLLPDVAERAAPTAVSQPIRNPAGGQAIGPGRRPLWLEPVTAIAPAEWPPAWGGPRPNVPSLAISLGCYWLWCFALAPRIWRGRRGAGFALRLITRRVLRELCRPPLLWMFIAGTVAIVGVWIWGGASWARLMTALVGLVGSGGIVWAVRLIGAAALRREAMGFGDVTLMMMIGTFLGWQACLITFFIAPFAGLAAGIAQFVIRRDDVIPYGPFLCLGAAATVVYWAAIWNWAERLFAAGPLVPLVLVVCLTLLGVLLFLWRLVKTAFCGGGD